MRTLAAILLFAFLLPLSATAADTDRVPEDTYPVVFEVARDGTTLYSHARTVMAALDIPDKQYGDRIAYQYRDAIWGYALYLTPYEAERAQKLFGDDALFGVTGVWSDTTPLSLPLVPGGFDVLGANEDSFGGQEVIPFGLQRLGPADGPTGNVDVAIIDTGIDANNPELNVVGGVDCTNPDATDVWGVDDHGHGTFVASQVGARMDGRGVVGGAPGARLYSVRVLDGNGSGSLASVICGIDWVAGHADTIDVANMSLGGTNAWGETACGGPDPMHNAICGATDEGAIFVVAAGNETDNASNHIPAAYPEVVTVSAYTDFDGMPGGFALAPNAGCVAMSIDDTRAAFSNHGDAVDIAAPGVCITGAFLDNKYAVASGTSMASPYVASCIARYINDNPDQANRAVEQVITNSESRGEFGVVGAWQDNNEPLLDCHDVPRFVG